MADSLDASCWLATNYNAGHAETEPIRLIDIYSECHHFFQNINVLPPSKDLISKLIPVLFNVSKGFMYSRGEQFVIYRGLSQKTEESELASLIIPGSCTATTNGHHELEIICWREYTVNNEPLKVGVTFGTSGTVIRVRDNSFPLSFLVQPSQRTTDGMVFILERLRICRGFLATRSESNKSLLETWSSVLMKDIVEQRVRAYGCKHILSFYSKADHCQVCLEKNKRAVKRHLEQTNQEDNETSKFENVKSNNALKNVTNVPKQNKKPSISSTDDSPTYLYSTENSVSNIIDELLASGAPENFKLFLDMQLQNSRTDLDKHQRKWNPEFISFCLGIYVRSPRIYRDLRESQMLVLPSESLLRMYKNCIKQKPGINDDNMTWMQKEAERQNIKDFGKRGGLIIDEMSLQDDLQIVRKGDAWSLVGGVDMGDLNNLISIIINKEKKTELATHSLQFVFHGFTGFRWPVAYYGSNPATAHQLFINFWDCIDALDENGFTVDYVMLDGASTNRSFMKILLEDDPRSSKFSAKDIFNFQHRIYVIQDIKHVIKKIRNNLETSKLENKSAAGRYLVLNEKPILWNHFEEAFHFNLQSGFRIHRFLKKEHFELTSATKMRNKLAEQVLDKDMLFLMKSYQATLTDPERLSSTVCFLENTCILVDVFNDKRPVCGSTDGRLQQLRDLLGFFNDWERSVGASLVYSSSKHLLSQETRDDINSSLTGFTAMCDALLDKGNSITPAFMNSDIIENHFCQQRGTCNGLNTNPTLAQYGTSNTSICLSQMSVSRKCNSGVKAENFRATTPCPLNKRRTKSKCVRV